MDGNILDPTNKVIAGLIEALTNKIGECRGRIEAGDSVIEFTGSAHGWRSTKTFHKISDEQFSSWKEFSLDLPLLRRIEALVGAKKAAQQEG